MTKPDSPWRQAVVYQIYPWTFYEDSGKKPQKGNGTLRGVIEKLPYINTIVGADVIWLTPFYPSPMIDGGYDVSDYRDIHPDLGSMKDFDKLVKEAHKLDMKVMIDFVPNHTSDQHEWFQKSRAKEDDYEDWYIWHPGKTDEKGNLIKDEDGRPLIPNNWACVFSQPNKKKREDGEFPDLKEGDLTPPISAWQWDKKRGEYYLRSFAAPDLNWSNPLVREAMKDVMRFWLDRGVDGFRVDVVDHLGKNMSFEDEPLNTAYNEEDFDNPYDQLLQYNSSGYRETMHQYVWEICEVLHEDDYAKKDLRLVMEAHIGQSDLRALDAIAPDVATTFNFGAMNLGWGVSERKIQLEYYYENLDEKSVGNQVNGNHDISRLASRHGDSIARTMAVLNFTLPGMRFIYNGEELGMHDAEVPANRSKDKQNSFRDAQRTPIIWDDTEKNAGFSKADEDKLWLPINQEDLYLASNRQGINPESSLALYSAAIRLCRKMPALREGSYRSLHTDNIEVFAFERRVGKEVAVVAINFSPYVQHATVVTDFAESKSVLSSVNVDQHPEDINLEDGVHLQPNEAMVIVASKSAPLGPRST